MTNLCGGLSGEPLAQQLPKRRLPAIPTRICGARRGPFEGSDSVPQRWMDLEQDGITSGSILHLADNDVIFRSADFQQTAVVWSGSEIDAHADQSILSDVAVPRVVMAAVRNQTVNATFEAADRSAFRHR